MNDVSFGTDHNFNRKGVCKYCGISRKDLEQSEDWDGMDCGDISMFKASMRELSEMDQGKILGDAKLKSN